MTARHYRRRGHVDHMVSGAANHVFVVFHHQHAVANVAQVLQGVDRAAVVVALMQANAVNPARTSRHRARAI
jgi:hypothetical protein